MYESKERASSLLLGQSGVVPVDAIHHQAHAQYHHRHHHLNLNYLIEIAGSEQLRESAASGDIIYSVRRNPHEGIAQLGEAK